jgi:myo-inositol-1(or 4)-monophosphatase
LSAYLVLNVTVDALITSQLHDLAVEAATRAGSMLMNRPRDLEVMSKSTPTDVVTIMDKNSERLLENFLLGTRPNDGILGEEGASVDGTSGVVWVVDPLDGTVNYLYDLPGWAVSVAAKFEGVTIAGCVYAPSIKRTWSAALGTGAWLNGAAIFCNDPVKFESSLVGTGFSYSADERLIQGQVVQKLVSQIRDIRRGGAAAVDLCYVASGSLDGYFEHSLNPWDIAAGELIVREAGGVVSNLTGGDASYEMTIAGGAEIHARLLAFLSAS